jgi:hypothetical protein
LNPKVWSDVRRGRASAFNLGERSELERAEAVESQANKFSPARMPFVGPNSAPNAGRIPAHRTLAAPEVRIHPAPPSSPSLFAIRRQKIEIRAWAADCAQIVAAENAPNRGLGRFSPRFIRRNQIRGHDENGPHHLEFVAPYQSISGLQSEILSKGVDRVVGT